MIADRAAAQALDRADPLAEFRDRFLIDPAVTYLDGNSLGALTAATSARLGEVVRGEWGDRLIRSWNEGWTDLPTAVGDLIGAHLLGAAAGQVVVSDSTTVNFYKLLVAALDARPGRRTVLGDRRNFPTDRYVVDGVAESRGLRVGDVGADPLGGPTPDSVAASLDSDTAVVTLSHVDYRSAALADMASITALAHEAGALVLWDLSHSAGVVPVELDRSGVDLAVGCTYKYLNGGPGAPAFLYVRRELQLDLRQPIWGWFGQRDQFEMGPAYRPADGIERFLTGTPSVLGLRAVEASAALVVEAGIERIRAKSVALSSFLIDLFDHRVAGLGFSLGTQRDPERRGGHVTVHHPDAYRICRVLVDQEQIIPDFREPDGIRLGLSPLTTRFVDVWDAIDALARVVADGRHTTLGTTRLAVT